MADKNDSHDASQPNEKDVGVPGYSSSSNQEHEGAIRSEDWMTRNGLNLESFKKRDYGSGIVELDRSMKPRHLQMIAIGGSIGAGFFVGSGTALSTGGPGSVLIDFLIIGIMMFNVVYALGELAVMYPVSLRNRLARAPSGTDFPPRFLVVSTRTQRASSTRPSGLQWAGTT